MRWIAVTLLLAVPGMAHAVQPGQPAPQIGLDDMSGRRIGIDQFVGRVLVVSTWASWCEPCREELPALQRMYRRLRGRGLRVVGINVDRDADAMRRMAEELRLTFPNVHDPSRATAMRWGATMMPTLFVVGPDGVVRHVHMSYQPGDERVVEREVRALLPEPAPNRGGSTPSGASDDEPEETDAPGSDGADPESERPTGEGADETTDETSATPSEPPRGGGGGERADETAEEPTQAPPAARPAATGRRGGCCAVFGPATSDPSAPLAAVTALVATIALRLRRRRPRK